MEALPHIRSVGCKYALIQGIMLHKSLVPVDPDYEFLAVMEEPLVEIVYGRIDRYLVLGNHRLVLFHDARPYDVEPLYVFVPFYPEEKREIPFPVELCSGPDVFVQADVLVELLLEVQGHVLPLEIYPEREIAQFRHVCYGGAIPQDVALLQAVTPVCD